MANELHPVCDDVDKQNSEVWTLKCVFAKFASNFVKTFAANYCKIIKASNDSGIS